MTATVQYITDETGERTGVLLDLQAYQQLVGAQDDERLIGLSQEELVALANGQLAPAQQHRLDELLAKNQEQELTEEESDELDQLLQQIDSLTVLKTRARYTLQQDPSTVQ